MRIVAALRAEYKTMLLKMKPTDITAEFINEYLVDKAEKKDGKVTIIPSKMKTSDTFTLLPSEYFNKTKVLTNVGLFIFNKFIVEGQFEEVLGYINTPIDNKCESKIEDKLAKALLDDVITSEQMAVFFNKLQWISMQFNSVFASSFTMKSLKPLPDVVKRKEELFKEHKEELENGDVITAVKIENELTSMAESELKGDPGMDLYNSGARGKFANNYKNISIMKGPVFNPATDRWDMVDTNFINGINKQDIPVYGNSVVTGAYPKAVGTQESGYSAKQLTAAFQGVVLDEPGSDCGTKGYLEILLTESMKSGMMYRYIIEKNKLVLMDDSNIDNYVGKKIKLRSPMYCIGDKLCSKCAGLMYEKLGIKNIGLTTSRAATTLLNMGMKQFHDSTQSIVRIDINKISL